ncbi:MAG: RraA family protein [bacterium]
MMNTFDFSKVKQQLASLDTASICDTNKALRVIDPAIRPVRKGMKLIGVAHTVRCEDDFLTVMRALKDAKENEVLVIDTQNSKRAVTGELFSSEAARKKLAGIIIDGACRDTEKIRSLPIPVYCRHTYPISGTVTKIFETQVPVRCGGAIVNPGDVVFGDSDGVIVASIEEMTKAIPIAQEIQIKETQILARLDKGESLFDMLNFDEHYKQIRNGSGSTLKFTA